MTRCKVCGDPRRPDVDHLLAAGRSARSVALELGLPIESMKRHARSHVLVDAAPNVPPAVADPLVELVTALRPRALEGRDTTAVREYRLALAAQKAQHAERPVYNILADPEWIRIRSLLEEALRPYPEARLAVAEALREVE